MVVISDSQFELLYAIVNLERHGGVRSLFQVAIAAMMEYSHGWRCLYQLEQRGLVAVTRNGAGYPLTIRSTMAGQACVAERATVTEEMSDGYLLPLRR